MPSLRYLHSSSSPFAGIHPGHSLAPTRQGYMSLRATQSSPVMRVQTPKGVTTLSSLVQDGREAEQSPGLVDRARNTMTVEPSEEVASAL